MTRCVDLISTCDALLKYNALYLGSTLAANDDIETD
jgi:hypothetical protein